MSHNPGSDDDRALTTALELLDGTVCECGHLKYEHSASEPPNECGAWIGDDACPCPQFSAVGFMVVRADEV